MATGSPGTEVLTVDLALALASGGSASAGLSHPQQEASSLNLIYQCQKLGFFQLAYRICFLTLLVWFTK